MMPARFCLGSTVVGAPSKGRCRRNAVAVKGTSAATAKRRRCEEDAQHRNSRLTLPRLAHYLASNLQVPLSCHQGSVMKAQSSERRRRAAVEEAP